MGGALATLAAHALATAGLRHLRLYTFGAPRIGNRVFCRSLDAMLPDAFNVTNDK